MPNTDNINKGHKTKAVTKEALCIDIENLLGYKLSTPRDFHAASGIITHITGKYISVSTLKRFWGYLKNYEGTPSQYTLNTLAEFLGYADFHAYTELNDDIDYNAQSDNTLYCIKRDLIKLQIRVTEIERHINLNNEESQ